MQKMGLLKKIRGFYNLESELQRTGKMVSRNF